MSRLWTPCEGRRRWVWACRVCPLLALSWVVFAGFGCSSTPPPAPVPAAVLEARHSAAEAARFMEMGQWQAAAEEWQRASGLFALLNDLPGRAVALHNQGQA